MLQQSESLPAHDVVWAHRTCLAHPSQPRYRTLISQQGNGPSVMTEHWQALTEDSSAKRNRSVSFHDEVTGICEE
ncbi:hypothetical protein CesoFtcFv8_005256 [Champsocephalus esox]|uniref:Uncharacterized protein n=1 Tax=Champsocephalus esox TaxID=159716 RepID=A0AAN8H9I9_9TELE|nr:hypothetical protein CesoFtcFv8_005256 [Champsocephalus esox]